MHAYMSVHICVCIYMIMHDVYVCMYVHVYICDVYLYIYGYGMIICMYTCAYVYMHMQVYMICLLTSIPNENNKIQIEPQHSI